MRKERYGDTAIRRLGEGANRARASGRQTKMLQKVRNDVTFELSGLRPCAIESGDNLWLIECYFSVF